MGRKPTYLIVAAVFALALSGSVGAQQDKAAEKTATSASGTAPASGARAEFLEEVAYYEQRYARLAEAVPAEKYSWRPGEGVRSIGEVFAYARVNGITPPWTEEAQQQQRVAEKPKP
jgi:hypothetical protein